MELTVIALVLLLGIPALLLLIAKLLGARPTQRRSNRFIGYPIEHRQTLHQDDDAPGGSE